MNKIIISILITGCLLATSTVGITAFESEVANTTKIANNESFNGYILYTTLGGRTTYLINNAKQVVHKWHSLNRGMDAHLLENGNLLYACFLSNPFTIAMGGWSGGSTGCIKMFNWNGRLIWKFKLCNTQALLHHDIEPLPNGNILMSVWEKKTRSEAIAAGCKPDLVNDKGLFPDYIIEVEPTYPIGGNIVWEWHVWDHLIQDYDSTKENYGVVADHPELIDINFRVGKSYSDWTHINSIDYNLEFDQILLSSPTMNEIFVIDHSTTIEEAAGHTGGNGGNGGDLLYRWGNPQNYNAGDNSDQQFFFQHDARWIEPGYPGAGHITIFNTEKKPNSSIDEIVTPVDSDGNYYLEPGHAYGPEKPIWNYSEWVGWSGAQRLPNGNTLISNGAELQFVVVTPEKNLVWKYRYSLRYLVFKMTYYPLDYPGLCYLSCNIENEQSSPTPQTQPSTQPSSEPISKTTTQTTTVSTTPSGKTISR